MRILDIALILAFLSPSIFAHAGHDHEKEATQLAKPSPSAEHPSTSGRMFEVVMERCDSDKVDLYICDSQTNQPITDAQVEALTSGDIKLTSKAEATKSPGVYLLPLKANEGSKVTLELKVSTPKMSESLNLTVPQWQKASGKCAS